MRKYGIEIEFLSTEYDKVLDIIKKYPYILSFNPRFSANDKLVIKPEHSTKGCEINIPPNFEHLQELCNSLAPLAYFNERCAMHIHVDSSLLDLHKLEEYYILNESSILSEAGNLYVNLNDRVSTKYYIRKLNMNIFLSNERHGTVEHRIYKGTLNYDEVMFAVNQTLRIIEESQKDFNEKE